MTAAARGRPPEGDAGPRSGLRPAAVRVPGSTSNLGAGFDCVGLAVDRVVDVRFEPGTGELSVGRDGTLAALDLGVDDDLLVRAFRSALRELGHAGSPAGVLHMRSDIPVGKGLGSSSAAVVAGSALAGVALGGPVDADAAFRAALAVEGHGDNAAPSAFGGLRAVVGRGDALRVLPLELSRRVAFAWAAPPLEISTREARRALPARVPFSDAVDAVWRVTALVRGLAEGDGELLALGFDDALHAPHRMALVPGVADAREAARAAGAWGVTVSGAGSGLLAVGPAGAGEAMARGLAEGLARTHDSGGVSAFPLRPVRKGVCAIPVGG